MKRRALRPSVPNEPSGSRSTHTSDTDDEDTSPPARKLLKNLLVEEMDKAVRSLQDELPTSLRQKEHRAASLIPEFDPDSEECTVGSWLKKIDQLGEIHNWDERTKSFYLQDKLRGQARKWYNRLDDYDYSWQEWKQMLLRAFPKHRDYASMLEEMLNRKKLPSESMTKYYQDKVAMCFRCKITDSATVSCIIRGLPSSLQSNARAFQCERPDELYEGFLCAFDDYRMPIIENRTASKETTRQPFEKKQTVNPETDPCPRCKKTGHMVRFCPLPDQRTCFKCGLQGHIAPRCPKNIKSSTSASSGVMEIKLLQNYNDVYRKTVKIDGIHVKAYIDTGSQVNVLTSKVSELLNLKVTKTSVVLRGFSGGLITSRGEVEFNLEVDGLQMVCKAYLTDIDMNGINLLMGQPIINKEGISLVVHNGMAVLKRDSDFLKDIQIAEDDDDCRYKIVTAAPECLPPGVSIVQVRILGNDQNYDIITSARHFELEEVSYAIPAAVLQGKEGYVKVANTGTKDITWKEGETLLRGERLQQDQLHGEHLRQQSADSDAASPPLPSIASPAVKAAGSQQDHQPKPQVSHSTEYCMLLPKPIFLTSSATNLHIGGVPISNIKIGCLKDTENNDLISILVRYRDCFASETSELGCSNLVQMKIKLTSNQPIYRRPYRLSHSEQSIVNSKVTELLEAGIIKESESEFASPVILVKKKNGDSRLCVDYRALNAITVRDRYPLPIIDDQVSKLAGKRYFTSLDMAQGYHQLNISPDDTHKTAFVTQQGHYEYNRIPFGLANAPSVFMRLINKIVDSLEFSSDSESGSESDKNRPLVLAFLDDLLLPSVDVQSGLELLQVVLKKLESENLKLNMNKCSFLQNKISYLGHEISPDSIQPGDSKLSAVSQFKTPRNVHEVRQFIGLCSYFRKFIHNFAVIARPLTELTKKNITFHWGNDQNHSFEELKSRLCTKPVLAIYDRTLPTEIHTDASKLGIAGILLQKQTDGTLRPVMYFSRVTTKEESFYHSYELETLAVVESLRRFRVYVSGLHIKVVTDCAAVRATMTKRDLLPRVARWWLLIQDYDISIEYRPGERMKHVDALSRNPIDATNILRLEISDWFYTVQYQDDKLKQIIDLIKSGRADDHLTNNYAIIDDRLYRKTLNGNRLVVPGMARWKIAQMHHDDIGHVGFSRCIELIKNDFWFPKMTRFIRKYVSACLHCAYGKGEYGMRQGKLNPIPKPSEHMKMVHVDHLGPFCRSKKGYQYILVITDAFSKFVIAEPTRTVNSVETIRLLKKMFSYFGYPERVVTDHGKAFTSRYFKKFANDKQFRHTLNAIACPRANGQVERTNRTLLDALRTTDSGSRANNWDNNLPDVLWGINNTLNDTTGTKPYDLMFAHSGRSLVDVTIPGKQSEPVESRRAKASVRISRASAKMKRNFDKRRKDSTVYKRGDLVLWKQAPTSSASKVNTKLDDVYSGPYIVTKVLGKDRYQIRSIKGLRGYKSFTGLVASDSLRPYRSLVPETDSASSSDEQLETEDLIDLLES